MNRGNANRLARDIAKRLGLRKESYPKALSALGAWFRLRGKVHEMNLHVFVGDAVVTTWVRGFVACEPFSGVAFAVNEPHRASALAYHAHAELDRPVFVNDDVYCDTGMVRRFIGENRTEIEQLQLNTGEKFYMQPGQMGLVLQSRDVDTLCRALDIVRVIFERYRRPFPGSSPAQAGLLC